MRPKKVILCVNSSEMELSVMNFMLMTNGYKVLTARTGQEAVQLFREAPVVDLVLADYDLRSEMNGSQLVNQLKQLASQIPMILLGDPAAMIGQDHVADALLAKKQCSTEGLLERIKIMAQRKRGPRKGVLRVSPAAAVAVA